MTALIFRRTIALAVMLTTGLIPNLMFAPAAGAASPVLRANLVVVGGEDPSILNNFPAEGDARFAPPFVNVSIVGMDPTRFPAGPACRVEVRVGAVRARDLHLDPLPATDPENTFNADVTMLDFKQVGTVAAGDAVQVRIRCEFMINGVRQRHQTLWAGTLAAH